MKQYDSQPGPRHQRGAVTIMFGLMLVVLIGFAGLAIDLGRFFVIKAELQNAMDACALAAASQLKPRQNDPSALKRAVAYGRVFTTGGVSTAALPGFPLDTIKNMANFQSELVDIAPNQITFSDTLNGSYQDSSTANYNTAKYAKCDYPLAGLPIYFMRVLNLIGGSFSTQTVRAIAVATRGPEICNVIPVGMCGTSAAGHGLTKGNWIPMADSATQGQFSWVDYTGGGGGTNELQDALTNAGRCDIPIGTIGAQVGQPGRKTAAELGWNSRFGLYRNGVGNPNKQDAPPDFTGYSYANTTDGGNTINWKRNDLDSAPRAYDQTNSLNPITLDFQVTQGRFLPFQETTNLAGYGARLTATDHETYGRNRRIVVAPIVNCSSWTVIDFACALMLNPFSSGGGNPQAVGKLEYLGLASDPNGPCGSDITGPLMSALVK